MALSEKPGDIQHSQLSLHPIWLVGPMASGKSTILQILTEQYGLRGVDMDTRIVEREKKSIAEIWAHGGEPVFRLAEQCALHELSDEMGGNTVVATGGGAPCFFNNMNIMNCNGRTVFLDGEPELLADRTITDEAAGKPVRPLVQGMDRDQRIAKFKTLDQQRRPFYAQSQVTIFIGEKSVGDIVQEILDKCTFKGPRWREE